MPTTKSKTSGPSSASDSMSSVRVVGVTAPGSCRSRNVTENSAVSSVVVGICMLTDAPPRNAARGVGGPGSSCASTDTTMRPPGRPSSSHVGSSPPLGRESELPRGTWKTGTCTVVFTLVASLPARCSTATPTRTAPGTGRSTAYTVMSGSTSANSGTHVSGSPPGSTVSCRTGGPSTSSTKLIRALRWPSSASTVLRPLGLLLSPSGSVNQAPFAPLPLMSPIALASALKDSRPSAVSAMASPPEPGEVVARHRLDEQYAPARAYRAGDERQAGFVLAGLRGQAPGQLDQRLPREGSDRLGPAGGDEVGAVEPVERRHDQPRRCLRRSDANGHRYASASSELVAVHGDADRHQTVGARDRRGTDVDPQLRAVALPDDDRRGVRRDVDHEPDDRPQELLSLFDGDAELTLRDGTRSEPAGLMDDLEPGRVFQRRPEQA